jgi:hypothetical protein
MPTAIAGIHGINFKHMPKLEHPRLSDRRYAAIFTTHSSVLARCDPLLIKGKEICK